MHLLFGKKKEQKADVGSGIKQLRETIDTLTKREELLLKRSEEQAKAARDMLAKKNKQGAMLCLKKKKMYDGQVDKIQATKFNLEQQCITLEGAKVDAETLKAMRAGANTLKQIHKETNIDDVDNVMDDVRDQMDMAQELSDALAQPLGALQDEDELLGELEDMQNELDLEEQQRFDQALLGLGDRSGAPVGSTVSAAPAQSQRQPQIPAAQSRAAPQAPIDDDEEELRRLEQEMAA
eukprot:TRINITY_DN5567_c0_g2_i4.p1 TRINITY_DN5567_c0_g2~~TRINITY_DN5567_c0_g2_i4.p1  ORF type:complete len:237 (-),score=84.61 TRINITY_DN5567_c0_g2_i4:1419-2129(-)